MSLFTKIVLLALLSSTLYKLCFILSDLHLYQRYPEVNVTEGEDLRLSCMVYADPEAVFHQWTMTGGYGEKEFLQSRKSLIIPRVTYKHAGRYICSAHNSVDQKRASTTVNVKCKYIDHKYILQHIKSLGLFLWNNIE